MSGGGIYDVRRYNVKSSELSNAEHGIVEESFIRWFKMQ